MSATPQDDRELDAFLARDTQLQRRWRDEAHDEPPPALDAAVIAAARRAAVDPRRSHPSFAARWRIPLSIAAVVVVSTTITLMVAEQREHLPGAEGESAPPAAVPAQRPESEVRQTPGGQMGEEVPAAPPPAAGTAQRAPDSDAASERAAPARAPQPRRASPHDELARDSAPQTEPLAESRAPNSGAAPASDRENAADSPASRAQKAPAATAAPAAPPAVRDEVQGQLAPAQPAEAPAVKEKREEADRPAAAPVPGAPARAISRDAARLREAAPAQKAAPESDMPRAFEADPQRWIEYIRALRAAGKPEQARDSLRDFRKRYPDYKVPPDLEALN